MRLRCKLKWSRLDRVSNKSSIQSAENRDVTLFFLCVPDVWRLVLSDHGLPLHTQPVSTARLFLAWALCWKQRRRAKLSQQSDGLRAVCTMVANGKWPSQLRFAKTNYLELLQAFIALKHFLPFLHDCHMLISCDSNTAIRHITHQTQSTHTACCMCDPFMMRSCSSCS